MKSSVSRGNTGKVKVALIFILSITVLLLIFVALWFFLRQEEGPSVDPRRAETVKVLQEVSRCVLDGDRESIIDHVLLPKSLESRTPQEQGDLLVRDLRTEVSDDGIEFLVDKGKFGPLLEIFPEKGPKWADVAGVVAGNCVAFRLDIDDVTAEVVLVKKEGHFLIVRCNDVKRVADIVKKQEE